MKIIFTIGRYKPLIGGAEKQSERLAKIYKEKGHHVHIVTTCPPGAKVYENDDGVEITRIKGIGFGRLKILSLIHLFEIKIKELLKEYDVVHVHQAMWQAYSGVKAAKKMNKKVVVKCANSGVAFDLDGLQKSFPFGLGKTMSKTIAESVDCFTAINDLIIDDLNRWDVGNERIQTIPNGIQLINFSEDHSQDNIKKRLGLNNNLAILGVASFKKNKNHEFFIRSLKELDKSFKDYQVVFLGDGALRKQMMNLCSELGLSNKVFFRGWVHNVEEYLKCADIFVLPSIAEGMSNSLLEAMNYGLPCAVSSISGNVKLIKHEENGVVFDPQDISSCVSALKQLLNDKEKRIRFGSFARKTIENGFSLDFVADSYLKLYEKLMD